MYGNSEALGKAQSLGFLMIGLSGYSLTDDERAQLMHPAVAGVVLFRRNYASPEQLRALTQEIHGLRHPRLLVSVDHEGGRVQRFEFPGIQGLGYTEFIEPEKLEEHIQRIRAEGFPNYTVRPEGQRAQYSSIIYLEPFNERNQRAFGYDMFSESTRREAMVRAAETGKPAITRKVRLLQENSVDEQAGFLMYMPVYDKSMPVSSRVSTTEHIKGYVYAPFRMKDLMRGVFGDQYAQMSLEIYDGVKSPENLMLAVHHNDQHDEGLSLEVPVGSRLVG